jgi:hypothetical protein
MFKIHCIPLSISNDLGQMLKSRSKCMSWVSLSSVGLEVPGFFLVTPTHTVEVIYYLSVKFTYVLGPLTLTYIHCRPFCLICIVCRVSPLQQMLQMKRQYNILVGDLENKTMAYDR